MATTSQLLAFSKISFEEFTSIHSSLLSSCDSIKLLLLESIIGLKTFIF